MSTSDDDKILASQPMVAVSFSKTVATLAVRVEALAVTTRDIGNDIIALTHSIDYRAKRNNARMLAMAVGLVSILVLTIFSFMHAEDDDKIRTQVLCPLYKVFVDSYNPTGPAAKAQGLEAYNAAFVQIRIQYGVLRCTPERGNRSTFVPPVPPK